LRPGRKQEMKPKQAIGRGATSPENKSTFASGTQAPFQPILPLRPGRKLA